MMKSPTADGVREKLLAVEEWSDPTAVNVTRASPAYQVIPAELSRLMIPLIADASDVSYDEE